MTYKKVIDELEAGGEIRHTSVGGNAKYYLHYVTVDIDKGGRKQGYIQLDNRTMNIILRKNICKLFPFGIKVGGTQFGELQVKL